MKLQNSAFSIIIAIAVVIILIYGKDILIPLVLALMVWFLIKVVRDFVKKIKPMGRILPLWISNVISFLLIFSILGIMGKLLSVNIKQMYLILPEYEKNIIIISESINQSFNIDINSLVNDFIGDFDFSGILKNLLNSISAIFGSAFMVILYVVFLMLEESIFPMKVKAIFSEPEKHKKANKLIKQLSKSINDYIFLKTIVSLITGVLSYFALLIIGVDFAFFWAFLIFVLNFIPTIGSLIATIFPSIIALLQFGEIGPFVAVLACIGSIQLIVGNIIEPRVMGNSLNISTLVVLVALSFWGALWGITGMILSVPITVVLTIIFAKFKGTRNFAIILSGNGNV